MKTNKTCSCGKHFSEVPHFDKPQMDYDGENIIGFIWECECGSSMLHLIKKHFIKNLPKVTCSFRMLANELELAKKLGLNISAICRAAILKEIKESQRR